MAALARFADETIRLGFPASTQRRNRRRLLCGVLSEPERYTAPVKRRALRYDTRAISLALEAEERRYKLGITGRPR